jgi:hypothetical protein
MLEPSVVPALNPGYKVVIALACLALLVIAFGVWALVSERRRLRRRISSPRVEPVVVVAPPPPADASVDALEQSLSSLERFASLQSDLRHRLALANSEMEAERGNVGSAVQLMRRAALEMRLPDTVERLQHSCHPYPQKLLHDARHQTIPGFGMFNPNEARPGILSLILSTFRSCVSACPGVVCVVFTGTSGGDPS